MHALYVLPKLKHLLPRHKFVHTDNRDRQELYISRSSLLYHANKRFDVELILRLDVENELLQARTSYEFGGVFFRIQGENEGKVMAFGEYEGVEVVHGGKSLRDRVFFDVGLSGMFVSRNRQPVGCQKDRCAEGEENPTSHSVWGDGFIFPESKDTQPPAWSIHSYKLLYHTEVEVNRGDMREVPEVGGGFWEVVSKRRFLTAEGELQYQRCPDRDMEVIQEDGMCRLCGDRKHVQMGWVCYSPGRSVR